MDKKLFNPLYISLGILALIILASLVALTIVLIRRNNSVVHDDKKVVEQERKDEVEKNAVDSKVEEKGDDDVKNLETAPNEEGMGGNEIATKTEVSSDQETKIESEKGVAEVVNDENTNRLIEGERKSKELESKKQKIKSLIDELGRVNIEKEGRSFTAKSRVEEKVNAIIKGIEEAKKRLNEIKDNEGYRTITNLGINGDLTEFFDSKNEGEKKNFINRDCAVNGLPIHSQNIFRDSVLQKYKTFLIARELIGNKVDSNLEFKFVNLSDKRKEVTQVYKLIHAIERSYKTFFDNVKKLKNKADIERFFWNKDIDINFEDFFKEGDNLCSDNVIENLAIALNEKAPDQNLGNHESEEVENGKEREELVAN